MEVFYNVASKSGFTQGVIWGIVGLIGFVILCYLGSKIH